MSLLEGTLLPELPSAGPLVPLSYTQSLLLHPHPHPRSINCSLAVCLHSPVFVDIIKHYPKPTLTSTLLHEHIPILIFPFDNNRLREKSFKANIFHP